MPRKSPDWHGLYCDVATQFTADGQVDLEAMHSVCGELSRTGANGLVVLGSTGESGSLDLAEKIAVLRCAVASVNGAVPIVAAMDERGAALFVTEAARCGIAALMVRPPRGGERSVLDYCAHIRTIAFSTDLPLILSGLSFEGRDLIACLERLADVSTVVAVNSVFPDTRRITDIQDRFEGRYSVLAGCDRIAFESIVAGAVGWISKIANVFPNEALELFQSAIWGELSEAHELRRWLKPLVQFESDPDSTQAIKLAASLLGRGSEHVRTRRLDQVRRREEVLDAVHSVIASRLSRLCMGRAA